MEYTPPHAALPPGLPSLQAAFAAVPDPRRSPNTTYPVSALLRAAVAAILANHLSVLAIAEWLAGQNAVVQHALGFAPERIPCQSTFQRFFKVLDPDALNTVLTRYFDPRVVGDSPERGTQAVAIDGKSLRGTLPFQTTGTPTHLLSLFCHELNRVFAQCAVAPTQNEASAAPALLAQIAWPGRVLTGDAMFCDQRVCRQVVAAGGDYLVTVKANQPQLLQDVEVVFDPTLAGGTACATTTVVQADKGHGRVEVRQLTVTSDLADYAAWPHLAQVFQIERTWIQRGRTRKAVHYAVTSLPERCAVAAALLRRKRQHWHIENKLHYVRDVTFGEDRSTIHVGHGPHVVAALRNTALNLLRQAGVEHIATTLRYNSGHSSAVLSLLHLVPPNA